MFVERLNSKQKTYLQRQNCVAIHYVPCCRTLCCAHRTPYGLQDTCYGIRWHHVTYYKHYGSSSAPHCGSSRRGPSKKKLLPKRINDIQLPERAPTEAIKTGPFQKETAAKAGPRQGPNTGAGLYWGFQDESPPKRNCCQSGPTTTSTSVKMELGAGNCCYHKLPSRMRSRDIFGQLRLRLRLRWSVPAPAPSKTFRRLRLRLRFRAKCTGSGGSGSDAQVLIWALTSNTIFKNVQYQNMTSYWLDLEFESYFEWLPLKFVTHCHPKSVAGTGEVTNSSGLRCRR